MQAISRMFGEIYAVYTKLPSRNCFESRKISHLNILLSNCSPRGGAFLLSEATKVASETASIIWKIKTDCKENASIGRNTCVIIPHILLEEHISRS